MDEILVLSHLTKAFPGVLAIDDVSFSVNRGEIHALLGENGAGKSTLIKMISGAQPPDEGHMTINGEKFAKLTPSQAKKAGVAVIYQEFTLIESMSVADNIFIGEKSGWLIDEKSIRNRAMRLIDSFHMNLDPDVKVRDLSPAKKQIVEILKALSQNADILIMDEPTATLSSNEVDALFDIIMKLKAKGITILYISHRMQELFKIADRVSVFRDGKYIKTLNTCDTTRKELISLMVGRELTEVYPAHKPRTDKVVLELLNVYGNGDANISLKLYEGEILGIGGLVGAGRTELAALICASERVHKGHIRINGKDEKLKSPSAAIRKGISIIPEDRRNLGCLQKKSIRFNISISSLRQICRFFVINKGIENGIVRKFQEKLNIKAASIDVGVSTLSGGNQQKVVVAKALAARSSIIIFDEPTRGIDVGAKQEIYRIMADLADEGKSIIMISSDMPELLGMSDRIIVLAEGKVAGELKKEDFSQENVLQLASV